MRSSTGSAPRIHPAVGDADGRVNERRCTADARMAGTAPTVKLWIDCDAGIDDAQGLCLTFSMLPRDEYGSSDVGHAAPNVKVLRS